MLKARSILLAEMARRERVKTAILGKFEFTGDPRHAVLQAEVVSVVLPVIGRKAAVSGVWVMVRQCVEALGGEVIRPHNRSVFRKVRPLGVSPTEALEHGRRARGHRSHRA